MSSIPEAGRKGARRRTTLRVGAVAVSGALLAASIAACSSSSGGGAAKSTGVEQGKTYDLTYWSWTKGSAEAVAAFNKTHPNIHVTFEQIPSGSAGGYSKITDAMKAGNGPDVFNAEYVALPSFVANGQVADISSYLGGDALRGYSAQSVNLVTLGGQKWAVPNDLPVQIMYYRKDLFAKYGLTVPKTWAQFRATARRVAKAHPGIFLSNVTVDDPATLEGMVWQAGAQWFKTSGNSWQLNFNDTATRKVAAYWQGMIADKLVDPVLSSATGFTADVQKGKILTQLSASWQAGYNVTSYPDQSGKWGVAPMPTFDGQPASGVVGGSSYAISKKSKNIPAAVEFSRWMTSNAGAVKARVAGNASTTFANSAAEATAKASFDSPYYKGQDVYNVFEASAKGLKPWTWGPTMLGTNPVLGTALKSILSGGTIESAIATGEKDAKSEMTSMGLSVQGAS